MIELGGIVVLGIMAQWLAWRLKVPAILPLIIIGLLVGPISSLYTEHGQKLIEPIWNGQHGLFPGDGLFHFVELAIGVILFEGGLTLKREEVTEVGDSIIKLITIGSLITFIGGGLLAHFIIDLNWQISFLFSALIIVTGPTVIAPILRNVPLSKNVSTVLKWEGILIDPLGALAAVLVYEFISTSAITGGGAFTTHALIQFAQILLEGGALGFLGAYSLRFMLQRDWIPHYLLTIFVLAFVLLIFVMSGILVDDSGLLAVVVMGMVLGNTDVPHIKEITYFKESLSILLISILFILLSANITIADLLIVNNWQSLLLFALVIFLLRPLGVFVSTRNSNLARNEKLFISWMGPRGIVAAGIASLFGLKLVKAGVPGAEYITPLVFMIVLGTVLLNATTARLIAGLLGVKLQSSEGILIMGATRGARLIASYLVNLGKHVVLVDSNRNKIKLSENEGLTALMANIYSDDLVNSLELNDMGYLLAMTSSVEVNEYAIKKYAKDFGENGTYRLISVEELKNSELITSDGLFSINGDFINLSEIARDYPTINDIPINNHGEFEQLVSKFNPREAIPLFIIDSSGKIQILNALHQGVTVEEDSKLVYIGKEIAHVESTQEMETEAMS